MRADIVRVEQSGEGTFGVLLLDGDSFCVTLELPWRRNQKSISCIPAGKYQCQRVKSPLVQSLTKGKWIETFEIRGVPGRDKILFHAGNLIENTRGCVLTAQYFGKLKGDRAVLNSGDTFDRFMVAMAGVKAFTLTVTDAFTLTQQGEVVA